MKTSSLPPNEPAADRAIDALLREHARLHTHDDEDFLAKFEKLLASESDRAVANPPTIVMSSRRSAVFKFSAMVAAAAAVLTFGMYWNASHERETSSLAVVERKTGATVMQMPPPPATFIGAKEIAKKQPSLRMDSSNLAAAPSDPMPFADGPDVMTKDFANQRAEVQIPLIASAEGGSRVLVAGGTVEMPGTPQSPSTTITIPTRTRSLSSNTWRLLKDSRRQVVEAPEEQPPLPGNRYTSAPPNPFRAVTTDPLSTFSVDVDTASYANLRRILQSGGSVPPEAVRIEEMINYFPYHYEEPQGAHPFSVKVESASCPWEPSHRLVKIALKAKEIDRSKRSPANLVFLIDVSGSMQGADRLGLVVENLRVLTNALLPDDTVAIVTYAGNEGLALPPTSGADKATILAKLDSLGAGGSTNGGAGITLAYSTAQSRLLKEGINRVILCTDGDFNVGTNNESALVDLVAAEAKKGVFLTVCGYGSGNLNDSMMEAITNNGNGVYHYIDSAREGRKVFQDELLGTLFTVAKDVKLQIEFNPQHAAQYRLIGYNNRMLAKEDFANDKVDAGDIGAGHRVTALYEVIPVGAPGASSIPLKYGQPAATEKPAEAKPLNPELLTVKLRYKEPTADVSQPFDVPFVEDTKAQPSVDLTFAATVAEFGERLQGHTAPGRTIDQLIEAAEAARRDDPHGHRAEFIELMRKSGR